MRLKDLDDQWLLKTHFFGIYTKAKEAVEEWSAGQVYLANPQNPTDRLPKSVVSQAIKEAISEMEKIISARITYREQITEYHDYDIDMYNYYVQTVLRWYPVVRLRSLQLTYGRDGQVIWDIPDEALQLKEPGSKFGIVNVLPQWGTHETMDPAYASLFPAAIAAGFAPNFIHVSYDAGMDGFDEDLDDLIVKAIGMKASIHLFNLLGDIVLGAGIANVSVSVDGLSQSIGTTSSAENSAYSARIREYDRELTGHMGTPGIIQQLQKEWRRPIVGLL